MAVGTEEARKSSPSLAAHEMSDPRAPRKDLPALPQSLVRSVPHKRTLFCALLGQLLRVYSSAKSFPI